MSSHYRRYREGDIFKVISKPEAAPIPSNNLELLAVSGIAYTHFVGSKPVAVTAASKLWEGCYQVWSIVSDGVRGNGLSFTKDCKKLMAQVAEEYDINRYHILVESDNSENIRWALLLGFEFESKMYKALPNGGSMSMYVMFPKEVQYGRRGRTFTRVRGDGAKLRPVAI